MKRYGIAVIAIAAAAAVEFAIIVVVVVYANESSILSHETIQNMKIAARPQTTN